MAIDDRSRIAYCEVLPGQGAEHSCAFLERAVGWFKAEHGIGIERVLRQWAATAPCLASDL